MSCATASTDDALEQRLQQRLGAGELPSTKTTTMYDDYRALRDSMTDYPWSSTRRLLGVMVVCAVACSWVLAVPMFTILIPLYPHWLQFSVLAYWVFTSSVFPAQYWGRFHQALSKLEIGRENGWKLLLQKGASHPERAEGSGGYLCAVHPHAIYSAAFGFSVVSSEEARARGVPIINFAVHSALLHVVPIFKEFFRFLGAISADAGSMTRELMAGRNVVTIPGGSDECMWSGCKDAERLVLRERKGFVKLALRLGVSLVPTFVYGESMGTGVLDLPFHAARCRLTSLTGLPVCYVSLCQRWFLPFPNGKLVVALGRPVDLGNPNAEPTKEQVDAAHAAYVSALLQLVDETKEEAGYPHLRVELV